MIPLTRLTSEEKARRRVLAHTVEFLSRFLLLAAAQGAKDDQARVAAELVAAGPGPHRARLQYTLEHYRILEHRALTRYARQAPDRLESEARLSQLYQ